MIFKVSTSLMRLLFLNLLLLFLSGQTSLAQETLSIQIASRQYDLAIQIVECDSDLYRCHGAARISLYKKGAKSPFQFLDLPNVQIYKDTIAYNPPINKPRRIYAEEYSFVLEDFNFDGEDDLAICNGRNGGYGSPSYSVYIYNKGSRKFVENKKLSYLTEGYLGLFMIDAKKKLLTTFSKSGCCYHETEVYKVVTNKPILIKKIIEDERENKRVVTTKKLINGKWVKSVRQEKSQL